MSEGQLVWLARLDGRQFDLGFTTSMKSHHLGAIKMASSILQEGRSPEARMLATQILTAATTSPQVMRMCAPNLAPGSSRANEEKQDGNS